LYYRLNVFHIHLPPLREHPEDIPDMVEAMIQEMNQKHGRRVGGVSSAVLERLKQHDWPGNARELRNLVERSVILAQDGGLIEMAQLPPTLGRGLSAAPAASDGNSISVRVGATVDEAERLLILRTLEFTGQNKTRAAEILGVSLKTLHNKLKEYEAQRESAKDGGGARE
ncbi:MAG TPA: helix-turn-helix domain-containing protein, partial [Edaphobacter sp.]